MDPARSNYPGAVHRWHLATPRSLFNRETRRHIRGWSKVTIRLTRVKVESNDALPAGSAEFPLIAALLAEQAKAKDHERQLKDFGFASFEFDKLPFIVETSGAWMMMITIYLN